MKYIKHLGLLALAASATLAFTASSAATTVTGPEINGMPNTTPNIHAQHEGTHVELHNAIVNIRCNSTIQVPIQTHGSGVTASGNLSHLLFLNCTDEWVVDTKSPGKLTIHHTEDNNGTLTSTGAKIEATRAGLSCIYETSETDLGRVTGELGPQGEATLDINGPIPRVGGSFLCGGATAQLTGSYKTTATLKVDA